MKKILLAVFLLNSVIINAQSDKLRKILDDNDKEGLKAYYQKGYSLETELSIETNSNGYSDYIYVHPLIYVTNKQNLSFVKFYLEAFKNSEEGIESYSYVTNEAFVMSMSGKNDEISELLFSYNESKNSVCYPCHSHTATMVAAAYGNEKWYFKLRELGFEDGVSDVGNNLLHCAVTGGSMAIVKDVLSQKRFDVNEINTSINGETPFYLSFEHESTQIFNLLLKEGGNCNANNLAWFSAGEIKNDEIFNYLAKNIEPNYVFAINSELELPVHYAMYYNNTKMALWLLEKMKENCDVTGLIHSDSFDGISNYFPLLYAIEFKNKELYEAFLSFASKVYECTEDNYVVPMYKDYKKYAIKTFGKDYVNSMYAKYSFEELK